MAEPIAARVTHKRVLGALVPFALFVVLFVVDVPLCPTLLFFGVPCPGCGLTRATLALASLELVRAHQLHPLVLLILPLVAYVLGRMTLVQLGVIDRDAKDPIQRVPNAVWVVMAVLIVAVWIARLALGTHPDGIHFETSLVGRALAFVAS